MKQIHNIAQKFLIGIIISIIIFSISNLKAFAQSSIGSTSTSSIDSLDSLPSWDYTLMREGIMNIFARYPNLFKPSRVDSEHKRRLNSKRRTNNNAVTYSIPLAVNIDSSIFAFPVNAHLLAWDQEWIPCNGEAWDSVAPQNVPVKEILPLALVWAEITHPTTAEKKWAIMVMVPSIFLPLHQWHMAIDVGSLNHPTSAVKIFTHRPKNQDIYNYLDSVRINGRSIFDFKYLFSDCQNVLCSCGRFMDGDVRENTWKAVTGEKPVRFFPNGK